MTIVFEVKMVDFHGPGSWRRMGRFDTYEAAEAFIMDYNPPVDERRLVIEKVYIVQPNKQKYCGAV